MREQRSFERKEKVRSGSLIIIAAEGRCTEKIYFEAMNDTERASRVHIEVLQRDSDDSSPESVFSQIEKFRENYDAVDGDEFWIVVDRDRWTNKMLSDVARRCRKNPDYNFCVSNPCFELWLILHLEDVASYSEEDRVALAENRKSSKTGPTWTKRRLGELLGSYSESDYDVDVLLQHVDDAIVRAEVLDVSPTDRWPQDIGTRVYLLVRKIIGLPNGTKNNQNEKNQ